MRSALGANRRRLTQQLIVEAMLIAAAASALGAVLAAAGFPRARASAAARRVGRRGDA